MVILIISLALLAPARQAEAAWQLGQIKVGDGQGGFVTHPAYKQELRAPGANCTKPFGLVQMDNGQIAMIASTLAGTDNEQPVITFSDNGGDTWSDFQTLPGGPGRPMMLTYLGGGNLSCVTGSRYFSSDYGQTWSETWPVPPTNDGQAFGVEGNAGVDRDANGNATRVMEVGWHRDPGDVWPADPTREVFRYSLDGGRTWQGEVEPPTWTFVDTYNGQNYTRGVSEGSVVRAENGWLVAALRTDMPARFVVNGPQTDEMEGLGVSISQDNGETWSPVNVLFDAGRMHPTLHRLSNGDLVCTMIVRADIRSGDGLDSHNRGCDALVSHDNGLTWNLDKRVTLDEYDYYDPDNWFYGDCGHVASTVLSDGSMLTAYGKYYDHEVNGAAVLVKWNPTALPEPSTWIMLATGLIGVLAWAWRKRK